MPCLLALDTTTDVCSVAVLVERPPAPTLATQPAGQQPHSRITVPEGSVPNAQHSQPAVGSLCLEHTRLAPRLHSQVVLNMIDCLLHAAHIKPAELAWIAFDAGPGSFTGVRIGAAVAHGMAFGIGATVIAVPSSAVIAEVARRLDSLRGTFNVSRPSRTGWRYLARYALRDDGCECLAFDRLVATETLSTLECIDGECFPASVGTLAHLAWQMRQDAVAPALAQPFYVEGDSPWQPSA